MRGFLLRKSIYEADRSGKNIAEIVKNTTTYKVLRPYRFGISLDMHHSDY
jgi:hypothetical protein